MSRSLDAVLGLRRLALEEAKRALAASLQGADAMVEMERAATAALRTERQAAEALDAPDTAVEAFAAWLPTGMRAAEAARDASQRSEATVALARAHVAAARSAVEAVETLIAARAREAAVAELRLEQAIIDESAQRRRGD